MSHRAPVGRPRGSVLLYTMAFLLLGVSAYLAFQGNTEADLGPIRLSVALSVVAAVAALGSLFVGRR